MTLFDFTRFLTQNGRYLWFLWIDFDEKYLFGIVMSYTLSYENLESKICPISLLNLAPNLLKIGKVHKEFSNNSEASSYLLGHILLF
jgi:hypothetical protein